MKMRFFDGASWSLRAFSESQVRIGRTRRMNGHGFMCVPTRHHLRRSILFVYFFFFRIHDYNLFLIFCCCCCCRSLCCLLPCMIMIISCTRTRNAHVETHLQFSFRFSFRFSRSPSFVPSQIRNASVQHIVAWIAKLQRFKLSKTQNARNEFHRLGLRIWKWWSHTGRLSSITWSLNRTDEPYRFHSNQTILVPPRCRPGVLPIDMLSFIVPAVLW